MLQISFPNIKKDIIIKAIVKLEELVEQAHFWKIEVERICSKKILNRAFNIFSVDGR